MKSRYVRIAILFFLTLPLALIFASCKGGYRSITVAAVSGNVSVDREGLSAAISGYDGMKLQHQDVVIVADSSSVILKLDDDKFIFLEPGAQIKIMATGNSGRTKTNIQLLKGSMSSVIEKKLQTNETFSVTIDNISMVVRGTIFRITLVSTENGNTVTVQTIEGEVAIDTGSGNQMTLGANLQDVILLNDTGGTFESMNTPIDYTEIPSGTLQWIQEALYDKLTVATDQEDINLLTEIIDLISAKLTPANLNLSPTATLTSIGVSTTTPTPTLTPTSTETPVITASATLTRTSTATLTIIATTIPINTSTAIPTEKFTASPTPTPTETSTTTPIETPSTEPTYTLTVNQPENGALIAEGGSYEAGVQISAEAIPDNGYKLSGWLVNGNLDTSLGEETSITFTMPASDTTLSVEFELITYSLTFMQPCQGGGTISMNAGQYAPGDSIPITISPDQDRMLACLIINGVFDCSYQGMTDIDFVMPAEDVIITAFFQQLF